jgi:hypothetical protein
MSDDSKHFLELPVSERLVQTSVLISERRSDEKRWADASKTAGASDHGRVKAAAKFIEPNSSVLDMGAGAMALRLYLPPGCLYVPCDIADRGAGCIVADLNKGEFPVGRYDYITVLGVLEYIHNPKELLAKCRAAAKNLIIQYNVDHLTDLAARRANGWVNDLSHSQLVEILNAVGWSSIRIEGWIVICQ